MERAVQVFEGKIRRSFFPELGVPEIDGFQSMQVIEEHQYEHTALTQVADAIEKDSDPRCCGPFGTATKEGEGTGSPESVHKSAERVEVGPRKYSRIGDHHGPRERADIHECENTAMKQNAKDNECTLDGALRKIDETQRTGGNQKSEPQELKDERRIRDRRGDRC